MGRKGPLQSLASNLPALLPNLCSVASMWALFVYSRVSAQVSKALFVACHSALFSGKSMLYSESCARWSLELAVL